MILLATNKRDVTTDFIVRELERIGAPFFRLNTEDIGKSCVEIEGGSPLNLRLKLGLRSFNLSDIGAAYYRRPQPPEFAGHREAVQSYLQAEWSAILRTIWNALEGKWLNCPFAILRAEDKPRQLSLARKAGFRLPATNITNDPDIARRFASQHSSIGKPLRHALIEEGEVGRVIFTSRIGSLDQAQDDDLRLAPIILQQEIPKSCDIRVIVLDQQVFATGIGSQEWAETEVDWRSGVRTDLEHQAVTLPSELERACVMLTKALGLRYSAIDLVKDKSGEYWFLEANPNGQWAWIEQRTGAPISAAIAEALIA